MTPQAFARPRRLVLVTAASLCSLYVGSIAAQRSTNGVPANADTRTITHVLNRIGFGPRPGDIERVRAIGLATYIDQQLNPGRLEDAALTARLAEFETLSLGQRDLSEQYFIPAEQAQRQLRQQQAAVSEQRSAAEKQSMGDPAMQGNAAAPPAPSERPMVTPTAPRPQLPPELQQAQMAQRNVVQEQMQAKMIRAALSERQLEEVLTDFWFNHFNVFVGKGQVRQYLTSYERDAIRPYVLGNFREMLGAVAHSPAMLFYLDNFQSASPTAPLTINPDMERRLNDPRMRPEQRRQLMQRLEQQRMQQKRPQRGLNENYGRELMELHTLGVDAGYTQKDVTEASRVLTGWTIDRPQLGGEFVFNPRMHDIGEKVVLGTRFPAGGGMEEGERLLDLLARHPATARHLAYKLAQRFVADEPPAALVERAAKTFQDSKGNLGDVTRVIITSPEFFAADAYRAKVKTPYEYVVSALRATGTNIVSAQPLVGAMQNLGMPLYGCQPPTGYSMTADAWVNTGALLNRMNFAVQLLDGGRIPPAQGRDGAPPKPGADRIGQGPPPGGGLGQPGRPGGPGRAGQIAGGQGRGRLQQQMMRGPLQVDLMTLAPDTTEATRERVIMSLLAGEASEATRQTLARAETPQSLVALTLGSPEFQRR